MIWNPVDFLRARFPSIGSASRTARRWQRAAADDPRLVEDMIRLGGLLLVDPVRATPDGHPERIAPNPHTLAVEAGRRELALDLLALMKVDPISLSKMMENTDV